MLLLLLLMIIAGSRGNCSYFSYGSNYGNQLSQIQGPRVSYPTPVAQGEGYTQPSSPSNQRSDTAPFSASLVQGVALPPNIPQNLVPVALRSSAATSVSLPPLKISVNRNAQLISKNDEDLVLSTPANQCKVATLKGGPANNFEYLFGLLAQKKDNVPNNTRASTTEDGVGFPIQVQIFFYKRDYGSFSNAVNYADGLLVIPFNIVVQGSVPNQLFEPYGNLLSKLIQPNSTSTIGAHDAFEWLLSSLQPGYYTYPGSLIILYSRVEYPCATIIQPNFAKHPFISYPQFKAFSSLLSGNYQPQSTTLPLYPLAGRRLLQADSPVSYNYHV